MGVRSRDATAVEPVLREIFEVAVREVGDVSESKKELFVLALLGREGAVYAKVERRLVTAIGERAPYIVRPFFDYCFEANHPFDMVCFRNRKKYTVKVNIMVRLS